MSQNFCIIFSWSLRFEFWRNLCIAVSKNVRMCRSKRKTFKTLTPQDAEPGDQVPVPGASLGDPGGFTIGGARDMRQLALQGELDEVSIWGMARDRIQLARDMLRTWQAPLQSGLVARWRFNQGQGGPLPSSPHY